MRSAACSASTTVEFDRLALAAPGAGWLTLLPYFDGERTPEPARRHRRARADCAPTSRASSSPAPPSKASCAACSTALDALRRALLRSTRIVLTGGGARSAAVRPVFAGLCDRPVFVTDRRRGGGRRARACRRRRCVSGEPHASIAERWGLGRGGARRARRLG